MKKTCFGGFLILAFACLLSNPAMAFVQPARQQLPNVDRRGAFGGETGPGKRLAGLGPLQAGVPGVKVDFDEQLGTPAYVSAAGFLSGRNGVGLGISAAKAAAFLPGDPHRATKAFLDEHRELFGVGSEALAEARIKREFVSSHNGLRTVVWEQQLDGIPVFEGILISHTTSNDELVNISSRLLGALAVAADAQTPKRVEVQAAPPLTAVEALARAARDVGEEIAANQIQPLEAKSAAPDQRQRFKAIGLGEDNQAQLVWLPINAEAMRLCWEVVFWSLNRGEMFQSLVDVQTVNKRRRGSGNLQSRSFSYIWL